jgi:hypothetical protein
VELYGKMHSFLREIIENTSQMRNLLASFQEMEYEMELSVTRSKNTLSLPSSSQNSQDSFGDSDKDVVVVLKDSSNLRIGVPEIKINRNRESMMRKSNRISIADAIKISELQDLKKIVPLEAINSSSSVESEDQGPRHLKSKF